MLELERIKKEFAKYFKLAPKAVSVSSYWDVLSIRVNHGMSAHDLTFADMMAVSTILGTTDFSLIMESEHHEHWLSEVTNDSYSTYEHTFRVCSKVAE